MARRILDSRAPIPAMASRHPKLPHGAGVHFVITRTEELNELEVTHGLYHLRRKAPLNKSHHHVGRSKRSDQVFILRFSIEHLWPELSELDLRGYRSFMVPIFFLLGRHDWQMPADVAANYFDTIDAPCKRLVWFEQSAHYPPFEEPQKFERVLMEQVLPLARTGTRACPLGDETR